MSFRSLALLAALWLILPAKGQGAEPSLTCPQGFGAFTTPKYDIDRLDPRLTDEHVNSITGVLDASARMLAPYMAIPDKLRLRLRYQSREASAHLGGKTLELPYQIMPQLKATDTRLRVKHPRHTQAVISHEFGHTVFAKNFEAFQPNYEANLKRSMREHRLAQQPRLDELEAELAVLSEEERILSKLYRSQQDDWGNGGDPELRDRREAVHEKIKALQEQIPPGDFPGLFLMDFRVAYEELFADLTAVSTLQNPRAIYASIFPFATSAESARSRDFLRPMLAENWSHQKVHDVFGPVRYYLSQNPQSVRLFREDPGLLVKTVFDAILADMEDISHSVSLMQKISVADRNKRLIGFVEKALAEAARKRFPNP